MKHSLTTLALLLAACQSPKPDFRRAPANAGPEEDRSSEDTLADDDEETESKSQQESPNTGGEEDASAAEAKVRLQYKPLATPATDAQIEEWVRKDKEKRGAAAANIRYAYIPQQFLNEREANYARVGLSKAINSVAVAATDIVSPEDVSEGHGVVFALDLEKYWGSRALEKWNITARAVPRNVFSPAPVLDLRAFDADRPVSADRLVYNMLHGGIYNQLIDTPGRGQTLIRSLGASEVTARTAVKNAITISPRYIQRRALPGGKGAYWESFDEFNSRNRDLIWLNNPIPRFRGDGMLADFGTVASEGWYHMPNGLPAYFIWGNANQERTKAEQSFVIDPLNNKTRDLLTGACIFCHINGVQGSSNDMAKALQEGRVRGDVQRALQFWTTEDEVTRQYNEDRVIVQTALQKIVDGISDGDEAFNDKLGKGLDQIEPCFLLTSGVTGNRLRGDTTGRRHRNADGRLNSLR